MGGRRPKLLFAAGDLSAGTGGIATLSRQVISSLLEMHYKKLIMLEIYVLNGGEATADDLWAEGAGSPSIRWFKGSRWRFSLAVAAARCDLRLFDHAGLARLQSLSSLWRGRYVLMIHGVEMWRSGRSDYHRAARHAKALIANSNYTARRTREVCPGLPEISVCWPGMDRPETMERGMFGPDTEIGPNAMLIVGRLDAQQRHKGHDNLLEALPLILESVPDAQLVVAGDGDDLPRLKQRAQSLGIAQHVVFKGRVDGRALHALYQQCALFVMLSDGDGFGLVFLEAMMHRTPCVGLAGSAADEVFEHNVSGILTDRDDRNILAECLSELLKDKERLTAIGDAGYQRYTGMFTGEHHAKRFRALITQQMA